MVKRCCLCLLLSGDCKSSFLSHATTPFGHRPTLSVQGMPDDDGATGEGREVTEVFNNVCLGRCAQINAFFWYFPSSPEYLQIDFRAAGRKGRRWTTYSGDQFRAAASVFSANK